MPLVNQPTDRKSFGLYCKRRCGFGVTETPISDEQLSDRINDALLFWWDWCFDGVEHTYYKYQVTDTDKTNKYITLPDNIIGAVQIFDIGDALNTENMFDIRYQIALNDLYTLTSFSVVPYYMAMEHLALLELILVGKKPIRYNRYDNILHVDMNWMEAINAGQFIIVDCYSIVDPDDLVNAYQDRLLGRYATALIKQQIGTNTKFYGGIQTLGGVTFNGQQIYDEATAEIKHIEEEEIWRYADRPIDMIG